MPASYRGAIDPAVSLFSAYLTAVQRFVLDDFCAWCLASAAVAAALFALTLAQVLRLPER